MKIFRKICALIIIGILIIMDMLAIEFTDSASFPRGLKIIGLPDFSMNFLAYWTISLIAIFFVWIYIDFNKDKHTNYPKFGKLMLIFITFMLFFPLILIPIASNLGSQYIKDHGYSNYDAPVSGRIFQIEGCQFKISTNHPVNLPVEYLGPVPGQICRDYIEVEIRASQRGEFIDKSFRY